MSKKIETIGNSFLITDTVSGNIIRHPKSKIRAQENGTLINFIYTDYVKQIIEIEFADLVDKDLVAFASVAVLMLWLDNNIGSVTKNGALDVVLQDSTSPLMIVKASKIITETSITAEAVVDAYTIDVDDATGFVIGQYLTIYNVAENRVYFSNILGIATLEITLDTPIDFAFPSGSLVSVGNTNMNVNGSVTPQIFGIRNPTGVDIPLKFDIVRLMFSCLAGSALDLSKFGDIVGGLVRGLVVRRIDGEQANIFNVKTNAEFKGMMYDFEIEPAQGGAQDGFTGRITFGGQNKMGAVIRIAADEDLQVVIQDDLTSLVSLTIIAEGSQVID